MTPKTSPGISQAIPLERLHRAEWNANVVPEDVLAKIRHSLDEFGIVENLVARPHPERKGEFEVLSGNHRLGLYRERGLSVAPVVIVEVDDAKARVLAQTLNRTRGADDPERYAALLRDVLEEMSLEDVLAFLPETAGSVEQILAGLPGPEMPAYLDDAPDLPEEPTSVPGEVYELGPHRLMCGDSTDAGAMAILMNGEMASCVWTDPPYGVDYVGKTAEAKTIQNDGPAGLPELLRGAFGAVDTVLASGAPVYIAHPAGALSLVFHDAFAGAGWDFKQGLLWDKQTMVLGYSDYHYEHEPIIYGYKPKPKGRLGRGGSSWYGDNSQTSIFRVPRPIRSDQHPTMKPVELVRQMLANSLPPSGVVLDPFGGSGTTLLAAHALGRRSCLMELDPRYCDVIRARYEAIALGVTTQVV